MHHKFTLVGILVLLCGAPTFAQTAKRIEEIRTLVQKTNDDIARMEESPDISTIFRTELEVNKSNGPYPAVGIYRPVVKFYYTFGDREKDPYPNRLLKIIVTVDRSSRKEYSEFSFNETEQLIFYFEKKDDFERRLYFSAVKPIRFQQGNRVLDLSTKERTAIVASVLKDKDNLVAIFRRSLNF